ncbi:HlyD family efflux transporter periplasmic adaptor subunit [Mesobacterium sp. TK19101]|uniref:HlyD family efflux transporter periplasmic adaptor subunit n=1 Tax=Mesobacterium hydrothermale TaxID=3111907 RepID=A0ABU6HNH3_9RHOB|nr:HlyD family efflux transporter periplasmic adaptor subunit [Mesobacterium sp. TK19101]MEC3862730.1 HlyD family efflux transporter periplasmic adaptor subunit [Mesobacterium sp. TK19101]
MRFLRQSLTGLFLLSLTLGLLVYAGVMVRDAVEARMAQEPRVPQVRERVFAVNVVPATFETITPVLTAFGEVQSSRTLEIRAASSGTLIRLAPEFQEGGRVTEGQLLAQVDPADAQAVLDRVKSEQLDAEAEAREAERALALARDELAAAAEQADLRVRAFQRQKDLETRGVGTAAAVETAELAASSARQAVLSRRQAVATAEARVDQAATKLARQAIALAEAERRLADTEIRAGFSGTLSGVSVVEGRLVSSNEKLANLIDSDALEVAFRVSTQQYARLLDDNGQLSPANVTVMLDVFGTNLTATGTLTREGASVGEGLTGRQLFASLDAPAGFKPGDFVTVELKEAPLDFVARLPATALDASNSVLVLGDEDRLEAMEVTLLRRQGDDVLVRARGLRDREVVAERTPLLGSGIKVRPLRGETDRAPQEPEMLELTEERRAKLIAFVEGNDRMPSEAKQRILARLTQPKVPADVVQRIESRMGG